MLSGIEAGIRMILEEAQKIFALDEVQLTRLKGFRGEFVRLA